jgi:hypothetical protein
MLVPEVAYRKSILDRVLHMESAFNNVISASTARMSMVHAQPAPVGTGASLRRTPHRQMGRFEIRYG